MLINQDIEAPQKLKDIDRPQPIDKESEFNYDELFFSVTDAKSNITYANDVFIRISKYQEEEIIGQLHKVIRHPDMPRAVFSIFWDYLLKGKPVAAYVKNMAKDGSYYWVMALAFPCEGGYLSIRLKPGSELFAKVKEIYKRTLNHQKEMERSGDKKAALRSSEAFLLSLLKNEGFADYEEFMWNALQQEMKHREIQVYGQASCTKVKSKNVQTDILENLEGKLSELVLSLEHLTKIHTSISGHSEYILKLARSIVLLSLNAQVGSAKLNRDDLSLSVIAEKMGEQSINGEGTLELMKANIEKFSDLTAQLNFDIISAKLQVEMTMYFVRELADHSSHHETSLISSDKAKEILFQAFRPRLKTISGGLKKVPENLRDLLSGLRQIERFLMVLRFIHTTGKVEVARMNDNNNSFSTTFQDLVTEIDTADSHLSDLRDVLEGQKDTVKTYDSFYHQLSILIQHLDQKSKVA